MQLFKERAVGSGFQELKNKVKDDIQKHYRLTKKKCMEIYEAMCRKAIQNDVEYLEGKLRQEII